MCEIKFDNATQLIGGGVGKTVQSQTAGDLATG
jgi:hypothetical protein